ncbi:MAG: hypothetical protein WKF88_02560 [Ferruginibacter sp.]
MPKKLAFISNKRRKELAPGIIIECKSGCYIAYYEHRTDIIANGANEVDARKVLKEMYKAVSEFEKKENEDVRSRPLPPDFKLKNFREELTL